MSKAHKGKEAVEKSGEVQRVSLRQMCRSDPACLGSKDFLAHAKRSWATVRYSTMTTRNTRRQRENATRRSSPKIAGRPSSSGPNWRDKTGPEASRNRFLRRKEGAPETPRSGRICWRRRGDGFLLPASYRQGLPRLRPAFCSRKRCSNCPRRSCTGCRTGILPWSGHRIPIF